ncbi:MAG: enoyl-CoA hydratase/isomerase family protein [Pseudomonadota bacterium]
MSVITYETRGKTALVTMTNGENRQNPTFAAAMLDAISQAVEDKTIKSMVITANDEKNWSQGVDLGFLNASLKNKAHDDIKGFMYGMNDVFAKLLTAPFPVVAAMTGHAFGNGAILACACDFRFMRSDRGYFCFPEVDISIPFLPSMNATIKKALPHHLVNELQLTGRRATAEELAAHKVINVACADQSATLEDALAYAEGFTKARPIFAEHKRRLHHHILDLMETEDRPLIDNLQLMA